MDDILIKNRTNIESFIKELSEDELVYLNKLVVERIRYLRQVETVNQMAMFNLGDMVEFQDNRSTMLQGRVIEINKKTLTVLIDGRKQWNIHPGFLKLIS
jgi:hypothetical protein